MPLLRTLLLSRRHFPSLFNTLHPNTPHSLKTPPFPHRPITTQPNPLHPKPQTNQNKKPLHALFMESVGLSEKTQTQNEEEEEEKEEINNELKNKLKQLEDEVRSLKEKKPKGVVPKKEKEEKQRVKRSLHSLFTNKPVVRTQKEKEVKLREPMVMKELSPEMEMFVRHLYDNGYFNDANFAKGKQSFDLCWFETYFARGYIKFAAQKFATDNQQIAKCLSGSALKQVAVFGCPAVDRSNVFPAKRLRKFFEVPEDTVCSKCMLRESCKFINQSVWKCDTNNLDLVVVMKVVTSYALGLVHPQLVVTDEVNKAVSQLLNEFVKLSQTT